MKKPRRRALLKSEKRAIRSAIKVYLLTRRREYPRAYLVGFTHGIQTMVESLPHARWLDKMDKVFSRLDRILKKAVKP